LKQFFAVTFFLHSFFFFADVQTFIPDYFGLCFVVVVAAVVVVAVAIVVVVVVVIAVVVVFVVDSEVVNHFGLLGWPGYSAVVRDNWEGLSRLCEVPLVRLLGSHPQVPVIGYTNMDVTESR